MDTNDNARISGIIERLFKLEEDMRYLEEKRSDIAATISIPYDREACIDYKLMLSNGDGSGRLTDAQLYTADHTAEAQGQLAEIYANRAARVRGILAAMAGSDALYLLADWTEWLADFSRAKGAVFGGIAAEHREKVRREEEERAAMEPAALLARIESLEKNGKKEKGRNNG